MGRAGGQKFHTSLLSFFSLHVRLFLNSFAIHAVRSTGNCDTDNKEALKYCFSSAQESLRIVSEDFASMSMLRYGQDSILVMSAYSAIILLKLLRSPAANQLLQIQTEDIYKLIRQTAEAYKHVSPSSAEFTSALSHARFLENLIANDSDSVRYQPKERLSIGLPLDPRLSGLSASHEQVSSAGYFQYTNSSPEPAAFHFPISNPPVQSSDSHDHEYSGRSGSVLPLPQVPTTYSYQEYAPQHISEQDAHYQRLMLTEIGFGEHTMGSSPPPQANNQGVLYANVYPPPTHGHMYQMPYPTYSS